MPFLAPLGGIFGGLLGSFGAFLSSGTILAGVVKFGLGLAAQFALGKIFAPKVPPQKVHLETVYGEDSPRFVVLGKRAVRGHHVFRNAHSKGNRVIEDVYIVSHFRSAGVTRVRWEGEWQTLSEGVYDAEKGWRIPNTKENAKVWVKVYTGAVDQVADAYLIEDSGGRWSEDHRGAGLTYAIVTQVLDREDLPQPWGDIFEVEGVCYDWREDDTAGGEGDQRWNDPSTWQPSENPFVQMYNLERGFFIGDELMVGKGISPSRLPLDKWTLAANIADEGVTVGAVSKSRYASSYVAIAGPASTHAGNMEPLLAAAAATWVEAPDGEWPIAGANKTPVAAITDDDLMVEEAERISLKRTRSELVNTIAGTYASPDTFYESAPLATTIDDAALAEDGERLAANIPYEAVTRADVGDRLNDIYVRAARYQASAEICLAPKHRFLQPGEWITWTSNRAGGFTKTFEVLSKRLGPLGEKSARAVYVALQEVGDGIFDPTEYITVPPTPAGPIAPTYLEEVTIVSVTGVERTTATGAKRPQIRVEWTPITAAIDPTVTHVEIAYRLVEEPDAVLYQTVTADVSVAYLSPGIVGNSDYEVRTKLITLPERAITPSAWYPVTTTDTRMGRMDVYDGVVDRAALADDVGDLVDWIETIGQAIPGDLADETAARIAGDAAEAEARAAGLTARAEEIAAETEARVVDARSLAEKLRWTIDQVQASAQEIAEQDFANYSDKQALRTELAAAAAALRAGYTDAITVAVGDGSAVASRFTALEATAETLAASITTESTTRADEIEALAQQVTLLSAGSGDQFDWTAIWYFNTTVDGFTGNGTPTVTSGGFLRPANHATDPYVVSPDLIGADGSLYRQVRARIRKTGAPTWEGYLWWQATGHSTWDAGRRVTIVEPSFDDGVANITFDVEWTGTIDQIRLDLSADQSDTDCYEIDWIAVGRPSPGASSAQLYAEQQARISADAALSSSITALTAALNDLDGTVDGQATAIATLEASVTAVDGDVSALSSALDAVEATLPGLATVSALDALSAEVESIGAAGIVSNAESLVALRNEVHQLGALVAEGQFADHLGEVRLSSAVAEVYQHFTTSIEATNDLISSTASALIAAQAEIEEKAESSAVSALSSTVEAQGDEITALASALDVVEATLPGLATSSALSALDTRVTAAEGTITSQGSSLTSVQSELTAARGGEASVDARLDGIDTTVGTKASAAGLSALDTRVTSAEGTISSQGSAITSLENALTGYTGSGAVSTALSALSSSITSVESDIGDIETDISGINSSLSSQSSSITALENALTGYSGSGAVSAAISTLSSSVTAIEGEIDGIDSTLASQSSSITTLQNDLDAAETAISGKASQSALDTLSSTVSSQGGTISSQGSAITALQSEVDLRARTFVQTSAPTADNAGDLWFDSDDGYKQYRWSGSAWVSVQDTRAAKTFAQTSAPTATATGDLWIDTDDGNKLYRWNGSSWVAVDDGRIASNASAISSLSSTVSSQGTTISSQSSAITSLENALSGYTGSGAVSSAFTSLNSTVSDQGGEIDTLSDALTAVETTVDGVTASGLFRMSASYTPATGWDSRIGLQARVDTGDTFKAAGLFLEATETESRVLILADQFVIADPADGETAVNPFVFEDGAAYMENAYIGTVYFKQMSSFNGKLVLKGSGTDASIELFS